MDLSIRCIAGSTSRCSQLLVLRYPTTQPYLTSVCPAKCEEPYDKFAQACHVAILGPAKLNIRLLMYGSLHSCRHGALCRRYTDSARRQSVLLKLHMHAIVVPRPCSCPTHGYMYNTCLPAVRCVSLDTMPITVCFKLLCRCVSNHLCEGNPACLYNNVLDSFCSEITQEARTTNTDFHTSSGWAAKMEEVNSKVYLQRNSTVAITNLASADPAAT